MTTEESLMANKNLEVALAEAPQYGSLSITIKFRAGKICQIERHKLVQTLPSDEVPYGIKQISRSIK
jgi:hypothetical protein